MSNIESLYGPEFLQPLANYTTQALQESFWHGKRRYIGSLSFGHMQARWRAEDDATAVLTSSTVRVGGKAVFARKTSLELRTRYYNAPLPELGLAVGSRTFITTYRIDFEADPLSDTPDDPNVTVFHNGVIEDRIWEHCEADRARREELKNGLAHANEADRLLLQSELIRGATGLYAHPSQRD